MSHRHGLSRRARRVLGAVAALVVAGVGFAAFVLYPVPLFPHHLRLGRFSVSSDRLLPADMAAVVAEVERSLSGGELDRPEDRYRVYLSRSPRKYAFFCSLTGRGTASQALVFTRVRSMIISLDGIEAIRARSGGRPRGSRLEGSLAFAIAHETAHIQTEAAIRRRGLPRLPVWLGEGWADAAAGRGSSSGDSSSGLTDRARLAFDNAAWRAPLLPSDRRHLRWHVLVEYLTTVRGLGFDELAAGGITEADAERELRAWLAAEAGSSEADREGQPADLPRSWSGGRSNRATPAAAPALSPSTRWIPRSSTPAACLAASGSPPTI